LIPGVIEGIITCKLTQLLSKEKDIKVFATGYRPVSEVGKRILILRHRICTSFVATIRWVGKLALPRIPVLYEMVDYVADT
jgi:hypothetical protein